MERIKYFSEYLNEGDDFENKLMEALYIALPLEDKEYLSLSDLTEYQINESFLDSIQSRGKKVLDRIISISKNITDFLSKIKSQLSTHLVNYFSAARTHLKEKVFKNPKLEKIIKEKISADRVAFLNDLRTCKNVFNFYTDDFFAPFISKIIHSLRNHFLSKKVTESLINEKLNVDVVDKVVLTITEKPPFLWLTDIHELSTKGTGKLIQGLSYVTNKLGGPEFVLPVIASIVGLYLEHGVEGIITMGIAKVIEFFTIPFVAIVIEFIGHIALLLTIYELCVELSTSIDKFEERYKHHHNHTEPVKQTVNVDQAGPETVEKDIQSGLPQ